VTGCANGGPFATPAGVSAAATSASSTITTTVKTVGKSLKMSQKKVVSAINKNFEAQNSILRQILTSVGVSREKMMNTRMFGPQSKAYGVGIVDNRLQSVMSGMRAESYTEAKFNKSLSKHSREFEKKAQTNVFYAKQNASAISPTIFSPHKTVFSSSESKKVHDSIRAIVDPFPSQKIPPHFQGTNAAQKYNSLRKIKYSYLAQPVAVMSSIAASKMPLFKLGDWAEKTYRRMGAEGNPPQVVNDRISLTGYIDLMVNSRFSNQDWYTGKQGIHSMTTTGVMRELLVMNSVNMKMQQMQMRYMQQMAGLLAQEQAMGTGNRFNGSLDKLFEKVVKSPTPP
jgi:hypothetical protein